MQKTKKMKAIKMMSLVMAVVIVMLLPGCGKEKVDGEYLEGIVKKSSELTTAKIEFTGVTEYKDSGVKGWTKEDFLVVYKAIARIGIDVEKVQITSNDEEKIVYIEIPKSKVQEIKIDTNKTKYFKISSAWFNPNEIEDVNKALAKAEEDAAKEIKKMGNLEMADKQAESLIKGILINAIPKDYTIKVKK